MSTAETNFADPTRPVTLGVWKKAARHYPLLPSGVRVGIKVPDLARMIETGKIPNHLLAAAAGAVRSQEEADKPDPTPESIIQEAGQEREFQDTLVMLTVVDPVIKPEDIDDIPTEDKQFIVSLATRSREFDAEGEHIGGLNKSEKFRRFRGIGEFEPGLEGV